MNKKIICTICPLSCEIELVIDQEDEIVSLEGNKCARGKVYAIKEHSNPQRILTSTVRVQGGVHQVLPVRSSKPLPKEKLLPAMDLLSQISVLAPIKMGEIIAKDLFGAGVDLIATRDLLTPLEIDDNIL